MTDRTRQDNRKNYLSGLKDGIPIALGYFAVAFSLGIAAKSAGLSPFQGLLTSLTNHASAGQYVGFSIIAAAGTYLEIALATLIANARYSLMSCSLSQKLSEDTPFIHRLLLSFTVTDEIFGISVARKGKLNPFYTYGAMSVASPGWAIGTALGIVAGNIMPVSAVSAFSVALYGMFLAIIIPPARRDKIIAGLVVISFTLSLAAAELPLVRELSEGTRIIILTVLISTVAALLFPRREETEASEL